MQTRPLGVLRTMWPKALHTAQRTSGVSALWSNEQVKIMIILGGIVLIRVRSPLVWSIVVA